MPAENAKYWSCDMPLDNQLPCHECCWPSLLPQNVDIEMGEAVTDTAVKEQEESITVAMLCSKHNLCIWISLNVYKMVAAMQNV